MVYLMAKKPLNFKNISNSISKGNGIHGLAHKWMVITTLLPKLNWFNSFYMIVKNYLQIVYIIITQHC